jgi:hypothetical protein
MEIFSTSQQKVWYLTKATAFIDFLQRTFLEVLGGSEQHIT